jgi:hypothetical protein
MVPSGSLLMMTALMDAYEKTLASHSAELNRTTSRILDRINSGNENIDDLTKQLEVLGLGREKSNKPFRRDYCAGWPRFKA